MKRVLWLLCFAAFVMACDREVGESENYFVKWASGPLDVARCYEERRFYSFVELTDGRVVSLDSGSYVICWNKGPVRVAQMRKGEALCREDKCVMITKWTPKP